MRMIIIAIFSKTKNTLPSVQKNRNVIYNGNTCNIMDVAREYKGKFRMGFKGKSCRIVNCKMSFIPVKLCEFHT